MSSSQSLLSETLTIAASSQPPSCVLITSLPPELHVFILTYLRAYDLTSVQLTCHYFNDRTLITSVIHHTATHVYPPDLTKGFDTPIVGGHVNAENNGGRYLTYEALRNMEMLVVARVLSRPEVPPHDRESGFYVSKSWCKQALKWLEVQQEKAREKELRLAAAQHQQQQEASSSAHGRRKKQHGGKKLSKKQERIRSRKMSDLTPPWPNVNDDIVCPHANLRQEKGTKAARARRRVMDRQAWRVLKKLYPDSIQLEAMKGECLQCIAETETVKKNEADLKEKEKEERKKPLGDPLVRSIYTRNKGVPTHRLVTAPPAVSGAGGGSSTVASLTGTPSPAKKMGGHGTCPLQPGIYQALPRAWCHRWRKYLKTGDGDRPCAPDASALLCDAHKLPLIPPHLEAFLHGQSPTLLAGGGGNGGDDYGPTPQDNLNPTLGAAGVAGVPSIPSPQPPPYAFAPPGLHPVHDDNDMLDALRAAGLSEVEVQSQRLAMLNLERQNSQHMQVHHQARHIRHGPGQVHTLHTMSDHVNVPAAGTTVATAAASAVTNEQLDRENRVVVEILTDEEFAALEVWWPEIHSSYALRFAVSGPEGRVGANITWSTPPCRECDATGRGCGSKDFVVRNRARSWVKRSASSSC